MTDTSIVCPSCGAVNTYSGLQIEGWRDRPIQDRTCRRCPHQFGLNLSEYQKAPPDYVEPGIEDEIGAAARSGDYSNLSASAVAKLTEQMLVTTESALGDQLIEKRLGVITAECVFGMNIFRDMFASVRDLVGGRSAATQRVLRDCRNTCLAELKREALMLGADGIVGVDLDYGEFSGGGKLGMVLLVASGTAVKLRKRQPPE